MIFTVYFKIKYGRFTVVLIVCHIYNYHTRCACNPNFKRPCISVSVCLNISRTAYHCVFTVNIKEALYRIWCGANRLSNSGVHVHPAGQLLLIRRGKPRMDGVGIVFEL